MLLASDVINGNSRHVRSIGQRSDSRSNRGSRSFEDPTGHRNDLSKTSYNNSNVNNDNININQQHQQASARMIKRLSSQAPSNRYNNLEKNKKIHPISEDKQSPNLAKDAAGLKSEAHSVFDELQTITKKQAAIALELTKPSWATLGYEFSLENPNDPKTMELCVKRVTALLWMRLIAIGIMDDLIEDSEIYGDALNSNVDLSTTTLCRCILREPKDEPRNPQDDAAEAGYDIPHNDSVSSFGEDHESLAADTRNYKRKKSRYSKYSLEPLQVPCWWWPKERNSSYQTTPRKRNIGIPPKPWEILVQLRLFVQRIFLQHRKDLPFHNYTHAAAVVVRCNKLLDMILCTIEDDDQIKNQDNDDTDGRRKSVGSADQEYGYDSVGGEYYDEDLDFGKKSPPAFGLRKDPIAQIALLFSGLIHDVQHHGVTNRQLCIEEHELSLLYNDQSVQEKNSLKIAFYEFIKPNYNALRTVLFGFNSYSSSLSDSFDEDLITNSRYRYFRQTVVNAVLTTDIASPEQTVVTKMKWKEAFGKPRNHSVRPPRTNVKPVHQLQLDRRLSVTSDVSLPPPLAKGTSTPNQNSRPPGHFNRRGSNVSTMTDFTDDSFYRNQQHARGSGGVGSLGSRGNFSTLETVRSQHQMKDHELEYNDDQGYSSYYGNRRGSALSTVSYDSVAMMNHPTHSLKQPRRISTSMRQRRPSNESLSSYNFDHQQRRRQSNESYTGQHYLNNNNSFNAMPLNDDDLSYDGSDFANDSAVVHTKSNGLPLQMDRRMSAASYDSYEPSEWGGDSVVHNRPNQRRESPSSNSNEEIIQHRRYPHPDGTNGSPKNPSYDDSDKGRFARKQSMDFSTTELTLDSIAANSVEVNKKRLEDAPVASAPRNKSNVKGSSSPKVTTKIMTKITMETDSGDEIDISRYVWKGDGDSEDSLSLTPPSSVEDEYREYAAEYAAQFKAGGAAGVGLTANAGVPSGSTSQPLRNAQQAKSHDGPTTQNNGEYCGRVIVATTTTNIPINRRSSVSGAMSTKGRPPIDHTSTSNSSRFMAGQTPIRGRINRRASTGTFPVRVSGQSTALQGASIDENNPAAYGMEHHDPHLMRNPSLLRAPPSSSKLLRRGSLGTLTSYDAPSDGFSSTTHSGQLNAFDFQSTVSTITPDGLKKYKKKLGIRRSMDLSGESIENYSTHGESRYHTGFSSASSGDGQGDMMDYDEPDELRAAVVIETLLRVADVGHSIQNWENMTSWSSKLFRELCKAHSIGRGHDPRNSWYPNQIGIIDSYLRPLALQLDELGVFGEFNGVLFVQLVDAIRDRWIEEGQEVTDRLIEEVEQSKSDPDIDMMRFL